MTDNELGRVERSFLWGRQFLNPFALEGHTKAQAGQHTGVTSRLHGDPERLTD